MSVIPEMVHLVVCGISGAKDVKFFGESDDLHEVLARTYGFCPSSFYLTTLGGVNCSGVTLEDGDSVVVNLKLRGGIDFQHREGSKV